MITDPCAPNWVWECTNPQCGEVIPAWVDDPRGILPRCGPFRCPTCKSEMKSGSSPAAPFKGENTAAREAVK